MRHPYVVAPRPPSSSSRGSPRGNNLPAAHPATQSSWTISPPQSSPSSNNPPWRTIRTYLGSPNVIPNEAMTGMMQRTSRPTWVHTRTSTFTITHTVYSPIQSRFTTVTFNIWAEAPLVPGRLVYTLSAACSALALTPKQPGSGSETGEASSHVRTVWKVWAPRQIWMIRNTAPHKQGPRRRLLARILACFLGTLAKVRGNARAKACLV